MAATLLALYMTFLALAAIAGAERSGRTAAGTGSRPKAGGTSSTASRTVRPDVLRIVKRRFGRRWRVAWCISGLESGHRPWAVSPGGGNWGLFQINVVHRNWLDWRRILEPAYNTRAAWLLSHRRDMRGRRIPGTGGTYWLPWPNTHARCGV